MAKAMASGGVTTAMSVSSLTPSATSPGAS
jgi:hypothetical protein